MAALRLPKTGYAVAIDLGDAHSPDTPIHPRRKQEVGRRLALTALSVQYGQNLVHTGPTFKSITARGQKPPLATKNLLEDTDELRRPP